MPALCLDLSIEEWVVEVCYPQVKKKKKKTEVFNSHLGSESNEGKRVEENTVVRSLRNNIGEHALHANIDLDLQETWLISKRETAKKEEA